MASLRYPAQILDGTTDWFRIGIAKYNPTAATAAEKIISKFLGSGSYPEDQVIVLPMPSNIQDGNSVSYGDDKLNNLTAQGVDIAYKGMTEPDLGQMLQGNFQTAESTFTSIGNLVTDPATKQIMIKALAAEAVSVFGGNVSIDSLLAREQGKIMNPNMELLFNGVTLRNFRFTFKMTPRDQEESDNIKLIIRTLKQRMAAKGGGGEDFLKTPDVFLPSYKKGNQDHPFLHKFKPCFLKDMSVNYTGENVYAVYSDGTPVSMTMDLNFQEMFPIYESDYDSDVGKGGVGY